MSASVRKTFQVDPTSAMAASAEAERDRFGHQGGAGLAFDLDRGLDRQPAAAFDLLAGEQHLPCAHARIDGHRAREPDLVAAVVDAPRAALDLHDALAELRQQRKRQVAM